MPLNHHDSNFDDYLIPAVGEWQPAYFETADYIYFFAGYYLLQKLWFVTEDFLCHFKAGRHVYETVHQLMVLVDETLIVSSFQLLLFSFFLFKLQIA